MIIVIDGRRVQASNECLSGNSVSFLVGQPVVEFAARYRRGHPGLVRFGVLKYGFDGFEHGHGFSADGAVSGDPQDAPAFDDGRDNLVGHPIMLRAT